MQLMMIEMLHVLIITLRLYHCFYKRGETLSTLQVITPVIIPINNTVQ